MLKIEASGLDELQAALDSFSTFRANFRSKLPRVVLAAQKKRVRNRLDNEKSGPDGEFWPAWSEQYAKRPPKGSMLVGERKLLNSFRVATGGGQWQLGSSLPYAAVHHFGLPARNTPARPYFGLGNADVSALEDVIETWVGEQWP